MKEKLSNRYTISVGLMSEGMNDPRRLMLKYVHFSIRDSLLCFIFSPTFSAAESKEILIK